MAYKVNEDTCIACGACVSSCPVQCIKLEDKAEIDKTMCIGCGTCASVCPVNAPQSE